MKVIALMGVAFLSLQVSSLDAVSAEEMAPNTSDRHIKACNYYEQQSADSPDWLLGRQIRDTCHVMAIFAESGVWPPVFDQTSEGLHKFRSIIQRLEKQKGAADTGVQSVSIASRHLIARHLHLGDASRQVMQQFGFALTAQW